MNRGELSLILLLLAPVLIRIAEESHLAGLQREEDRVMAEWERAEAARAHRRRLAEIEFATRATVAQLDDIATDAIDVVVEDRPEPALRAGDAEDLARVARP